MQAARIAVLAGAVLLGACATPVPPPPPELQYRPPSVEGAASIVGSRTQGSLGRDDWTAFVAAVDGKCVMARRKGWGEALPLAAGQRRLVVEFNHGVFVANTVFDLNVSSGDRYELRFKAGTMLYPLSMLGAAAGHVDFSVVDRTSGRVVASIDRVAATDFGDQNFIEQHLAKCPRVR